MPILAQSGQPHSLESVRKGEDNMIIATLVIGVVLIGLFLLIRRAKK